MSSDKEKQKSLSVVPDDFGVGVCQKVFDWNHESFYLRFGIDSKLSLNFTVSY